MPDEPSGCRDQAQAPRDGRPILLEAIEIQHDDHVIGMSFDERLQRVVDHAHESFNHSTIDGLIRRAGLHYPAADLRRVDLIEERGLNRAVLANLPTCSFIQRQQNVVFQGFTGSGKSYLGCALAKQACQHRIRAHYIRMLDLEEAWALARDKPQGQTKFLGEVRRVHATGHRRMAPGPSRRGDAQHAARTP